MMQIDSPNGVADAIGRERFAAHLQALIQTIPAENGAVIGLEGVWGAGKTWVLRETERMSADRNSTVVVWFNPWMLSGATDLVESFLIQLAGELGQPINQSRLRNGAAIGEKLIDYARALGATKYLAPLADLIVPGVGLAVAEAGTAAEAATEGAQQAFGGQLEEWKQGPKPLSLSAAREAVVGLLRKSERRVVVFIDDLDRLPPQELAAMIRVVKAVADFPNVVYVLAYDPDAAGAALESALGLKDGAGRRYLEKIVQLPVPVPELAAHRIQTFASDELRKVMAAHASADTDRDDLEKALPLAAALMQTPRDVVRLCTKLNVIVPLAGVDLNPADLLLVEALMLKAPEVIRYVDDHRGAMLLVAGSVRNDSHYGARGHLGSPQDQWGLDEEVRKVQRAKVCDGWRKLPAAGGRLSHTVEQAMRFLFDSARPNDSQMHASATRLRLQNLRHWNRWRSLIADPEYFDNHEILACLAQPPAGLKDRVVGAPQAFVEFCALAHDLLDDTVSINTAGFCRFVADSVAALGEATLPVDYAELGAARLLEKVLRKEPDQAIREGAMHALIRPELVWFSSKLVLWAWRDAFGTRSKPCPAEERLIADLDAVARLSEIWVKVAMDLLNRWSEPISRQDAYGLAVKISHLGGDPKAAVARIVNMQDRGLDSLFGQGWGGDHDPPTGAFLPPPTDLLAALPRSPGFEDRLPKLVEGWRLAVDSPST